jgi:hypothetical protein
LASEPTWVGGAGTFVEASLTLGLWKHTSARTCFIQGRTLSPTSSSGLASSVSNFHLSSSGKARSEGGASKESLAAALPKDAQIPKEHPDCCIPFGPSLAFFRSSCNFCMILFPRLSISPALLFSFSFTVPSSRFALTASYKGARSSNPKRKEMSHSPTPLPPSYSFSNSPSSGCLTSPTFQPLEIQGTSRRRHVRV